MTDRFKEIPEFVDEDEEREFWATHDSTEYIDWEKGESVVFSKHRLEATMSVKEIETAIMELPVAEVGVLVTWLDEYYASLWDQEIEDDVNAGRFDALLAEIKEEYAAGMAMPL